MSLGIAIKAPEGLVLAAESRITLQATPPGAAAPLHVNFDNATKLLSFSDPNSWVGVVTYGLAALGLRTAQSYVPEFEATLPPGRLSTAQFAQSLSDFFQARWQQTMPAAFQGPPMVFVIGGYDAGEAHGHLYEVVLPTAPQPVEHYANEFGMRWGGQREYVDRLISGHDGRLPDAVAQALNLDPAQRQTLQQALAQFGLPIPLTAMPLQDCVSLAIFLIRTTISVQTMTVGLRGCGGAIDVATITHATKLEFVQRKRIQGEAEYR